MGVRLGPVVVNAVDEGDDLPAELAPHGTPLRAAAEFRNARRDLHRREALRLAESLDLEQLRLPLIASPLPRQRHRSTSWPMRLGKQA